jgi:hypothetical protein
VRHPRFGHAGFEIFCLRILICLMQNIKVWLWQCDGMERITDLSHDNGKSILELKMGVKEVCICIKNFACRTAVSMTWQCLLILSFLQCLRALIFIIVSIKRPELESSHSSPSRSEFGNGWSYYFTSQYKIKQWFWVKHRGIFTFVLILQYVKFVNIYLEAKCKTILNKLQN